MLNLEKLREKYQNQLADTNQEKRFFAYRNLLLLDNNYYSSDELIDLATGHGIKIYDPFTRISRGTSIGAGTVIYEGSSIHGNKIKIGEGCVLNAAKIVGNNIKIGSKSIINRLIEIDNFNCGENNVIDSIQGENCGHFEIGSGNLIESISIENPFTNNILVGNNNLLASQLSLNIPFERGSIWIGNGNQLGRDGGGVISSSYRFGHKWNGHIVIGNGVETTRGAEILGFSILGFTESELVELSGASIDGIIKIFTRSDIHELVQFIEKITSQKPSCFDKGISSKTASIFGVAKVKRSCLCNRVRIKDDTRLNRAYLRDCEFQERCIIKETAIVPEKNEYLDVPMQNLYLEGQIISTKVDWGIFQTPIESDEYPESDFRFFDGY